MIIKKHKSSRGLIVALCDDSILGKKFCDGDAVLDLSSDFYSGERVDGDDALKICRRAYIINAAGRDSVSFLIKNKFIGNKSMIRVGGVPYAQCLITGNEM